VHFVGLFFCLHYSTGTSVSAHYGIPYCLQNYIDIKDHVLIC